MPAAFIGHGNPMNALERNRFSDAWRAFGASVRRPQAILMVSAHWYTSGVAVTAMDRPRTIHDFYGFPRELYAIEYPAPGSPSLAQRVASLLEPYGASLDSSWGFDHGAWSVLVHLSPEADVPVVQLAIDARRPAAFHWEVATALQPLRDEGVLVLGSGNVVHNLRAVDFGREGGYDWANEFDAYVRDALERGDGEALVRYDRHPAGSLAVPTPDHYFPALYVAALRRDGEHVSTIVEGMGAGSLSMRSFAIGRIQDAPSGVLGI
jgi:4,5-DOPA dioxygenase extradiol